MSATTTRRAPRFPEPGPANHYLADHLARVQASLCHWTGRDLVDRRLPPDEQARQLFEAPFVLVSHDTAADPIFNYANRTALTLWEMTWQEFTTLPSRQPVEPDERETRARLLAEVASRGFIEHYAGVRIAQSGRRFRIQDVIVWNLLDEHGQPYGQAAMFAHWTFLDPSQ
jgi:hypothetical protein